MSEILTQIREILVSALSVAIVSMIGLGWKYAKSFIDAKINQVKTKTNNDLMDSVLNRIQIVCDQVSTSFDPIAEQFKLAAADGKLTPDEIEDIQHASQDVVSSIIHDLYPDKILEDAGITDNALYELIARGIEASLQKRKNAQ